MNFKFSDAEILDMCKEDFNKLPDSVNAFLSDVILNELSTFLLAIDECESPIEQLLGIAMHKAFNRVLPAFTEDFFVNQQETIEANGNKYRVDFFIVVFTKEKSHGFVVECDGHDFHEKTKEQARKDKKRDRDLQIAGFPVLRFTGSEIFASPYVCAREVRQLIISHLSKD